MVSVAYQRSISQILKGKMNNTRVQKKKLRITTRNSNLLRARIRNQNQEVEKVDWDLCFNWRALKRRIIVRYVRVEKEEHIVLIIIVMTLRKVHQISNPFQVFLVYQRKTLVVLPSRHQHLSLS